MRSILTLAALALGASTAVAETRTLTLSVATECAVFGDPRVSGTVQVRFDDALPLSDDGEAVEYAATGTGSVAMCYPGAIGVTECVVTLSEVGGAVRFGATESFSEVSVSLVSRTGVRIDASATIGAQRFEPASVPASLTPWGWDLGIGGVDGPCAWGTHGQCQGGQILWISPASDPTGACCLHGSCIVTTETACIDARGIYQGHDTECSQIHCPDCPIELTGDVPASIDVADLLAFLAAWFPASQTGVCE